MKRPLKRNTISIKQNETYDIESLENELEKQKFELTDFVTDPGQFSIRGGIVDIFSYAHEYPCRIEFFEDKIEKSSNRDYSKYFSPICLAYSARPPQLLLTKNYQSSHKAVTTVTPHQSPIIAYLNQLTETLANSTIPILNHPFSDYALSALYPSRHSSSHLDSFGILVTCLHIHLL